MINSLRIIFLSIVVQLTLEFLLQIVCHGWFWGDYLVQLDRARLFRTVEKLGR